MRIALALCAALAGPAAAFTPCAKDGKGFPKVKWTPFATGLSKPVGVYAAHDGSGRLFVLEQAGKIRVVTKAGAVEKTPFLDIAARVKSGGEMGLLGLAFHPKFKENGRFFVNYTTRGKLRTTIAEFGRDGREKVLLQFDQPYSNHNGGDLAFGPDGLLYVAVGDGGAGNDPQDNGQNSKSLLGKILTLDVEAESPKPEVFALGMRNPWRISFDPVTKKLWAGDVGQDDWEEIDVVEKGKNYGWRIMEGEHCTPGVSETCDKKGLELPVLEYAHDEGYSVTGGYVYRGSKIPGLCGAYVFGDFGSGRVWAARLRPGRRADRVLLSAASLNISSFGVDEAGEMVLADYGGGRLLSLVQD